MKQKYTALVRWMSAPAALLSGTLDVVIAKVMFETKVLGTEFER